MSHFRILRVDHYDPEIVGRKNRLLYTIYGLIPVLIIITFNLGNAGSPRFHTGLFISSLILIAICLLLLWKVRSNIKNLKTIGEIEITQSCLKKKLGDSIEEFSYQTVKELTLSKHIPSTRIRDSKSRYFSYILKIEFIDGHEESLVVSDRSTDHNHKLSISDTIKTLKKIVPFKVHINT
jgi:hypothetical protein